MPTPMPLTRPTSSAGAMAIRIAIAGSWCSAWLPRTKALTLATVPADMSMPPVSMVMVWQPASSASGMANCSVCAAQRWR